MASNPQPGPRFVINGRLGIILLAVWLIFQGMIALLHLSFEALPLVMGLLALISGILILIGA